MLVGGGGRFCKMGWIIGLGGICECVLGLGLEVEVFNEEGERVGVG